LIGVAAGGDAAAPAQPHRSLGGVAAPGRLIENVLLDQRTGRGGKPPGSAPGAAAPFPADAGEEGAHQTHQQDDERHQHLPVGQRDLVIAGLVGICHGVVGRHATS
jgi:hypothetical protein